MNLLEQLRARDHEVRIVDGVAVVTWAQEPKDRQKAEQIIRDRNRELVLLLEAESVWPESKWKS